MSSRARAPWRTTTIGFTALALLSLLLATTAGAQAPASGCSDEAATGRKGPGPLLERRGARRDDSLL